MKQLMIFDLDGTLINSLDDLAHATNESLGQLGFPVHPVESYKQFVGNGVAKLIERALPPDSRSLEITHEARTLFDCYYDEHSMDYTAPYKGIMDVLDELRTKGIKLAVLTNKPHGYAKELVSHYFGEKIDLVIGQQEGVPPKPDCAGMKQILSQLGCEPEVCLYIGDSNVDIFTAQNAGITSVGVLWGFRSREELEAAGADYLIENPQGLLTFAV